MNKFLHICVCLIFISVTFSAKSNPLCIDLFQNSPSINLNSDLGELLTTAEMAISKRDSNFFNASFSQNSWGGHSYDALQGDYNFIRESIFPNIHDFRDVVKITKNSNLIKLPPETEKPKLVMLKNNFFIKPNVYRYRHVYQYEKLLDFSFVIGDNSFTREDMKNFTNRIPVMVLTKENSLEIQYGQIGTAILSQLRIEDRSIRLFRGLHPSEKHFLIQLKNRPINERISALKDYFNNRSSSYSGLFFTDDESAANLFDSGAKLELKVPFSVMETLLKSNSIYSGIEVYNRAYFEFCFYNPETIALVLDYIEN